MRLFSGSNTRMIKRDSMDSIAPPTSLMTMLQYNGSKIKYNEKIQIGVCSVYGDRIGL